LATNPNLAAYLNKSGCIKIDDLDDKHEYSLMHAAFLELGFTHELIFNLFQSVAGILQAGNIEFIPNSEDLSNNDTCVISPASYEWFERVAHSWGVETALLEKSLLFRIVQTGTHSPTHLLTH
jgi:myosin heavy subunit